MGNLVGDKKILVVTAQSGAGFLSIEAEVGA
jgi:hypothetical protein